MKFGKSLTLGALLIAGLLTDSHTDAQIGPGFRRAFHGARMFDALQLTDDQKATIDGLFVTNRENARPLRERLQEQRQRLKDAAQAQPFDESAVRFQAQEMANLQAELMVQRAALMNQIAGVLTEEQKTKLEELKEQRRARFKAWRERRRSQSAQQQG